MTPRSWTRRSAIASALASAVTLSGIARAEDLPWRLPELRRIPVNGRQMAYYELGSGPPLVLIHGGSGSPALEFGRVMTPLARNFRVIAPYMIGYGPSDQPDLPYDAETFVDYLGGFLHATTAANASLLGESLGGWVVGHYAVRQHRRSSWGGTLPPISRLIVCDGALQVHPGEGGGGAGDSINNPEVGKRSHEFYVTLPTVDNSKVGRAIGPHIVADPVSDAQLQSLHIPTLVIWGRQDKLLPVESGRHIASRVPGARAVIIDDCGHIPSVEQPRVFLGALATFLGVTSENPG